MLMFDKHFPCMQQYTQNKFQTGYVPIYSNPQKNVGRQNQHSPKLKASLWYYVYILYVA